jgi:sugar phosphate permease
MTAGTSKHFYGWIAFSGAVFAQLIAIGIFVYAYGVFLPVMRDEFAWSRAEIALAMTLGYICYGVTSPLVGISVARFGPRINILLSSLLLALCLAGMSRVSYIWQFLLLYSLAGVACNFTGYITSAAVGSNWFIRRRSLAMGIISASIGLGGFMVPILTTSFIASLGWRLAWLALAGLAVVGFLSGLLVRNRPEDMGQVPDGVPGGLNQVKTTDAESDRQKDLWTVSKVLRQRSLWFITIFSAANFCSWAAMLAHQVAYVQELGSTPMAAATTVSVLAGASIFGGVGYGILALRISTGRLAVISFSIYTIAQVILITARSLPLIYVYSFLFGMSGGAILSITSTLLADYYGRLIFPKILGLVNFFVFPFRALAPIFAGAVYDATGAYTLAFIILTSFSFIGLVCTFLAHPPKEPRLTAKPVTGPL